MNSPSPPAELRPRFCPRCNCAGPADKALCPECGDWLADQGYCPICHARWRLPEGAPCPKHDVALEADPPEPDTSAAGADWVTVATFSLLGEAEARRLRLEAEGIPTFLDGHRMGMNSIYAGATGGIKLQVPRALTADARVLLAQSWTPPPEDELEDAWDDLGPEPGANAPAAAWQVAALPLVILLALFVYLVVRRF